MNPSGAGHDAVAEDLLLLHTEVGGLVHDELVDLGERVPVEEELEPLAGHLLAGLVLAPDPFLAAAQLGAAIPLPQLFEPIGERHGPIVNAFAASVR